MVILLFYSANELSAAILFRRLRLRAAKVGRARCSNSQRCGRGILSIFEKHNYNRTQFGSSYASILALSTRQAFSGIEITVGKTANGTYNTSDVLVFLKEISSDGISLPARLVYY